MRFLVDRCAGRRLAESLRTAGHDVAVAWDQERDPGDRALLARAVREARVLVTIDSDFGTLIHLDQQPHCGLVRLPDAPAARRIELMRLVLNRHADDLERGTW